MRNPLLVLFALLAGPVAAQGLPPVAPCTAAPEPVLPPPEIVRCEDGGCLFTPASGQFSHAEMDVTLGPQPEDAQNVVACLGGQCVWSALSVQALQTLVDGTGAVGTQAALYERVCGDDGCVWTNLPTLLDALPPDETVPLPGRWRGVDEPVGGACFADMTDAEWTGPRRADLVAPMSWTLLNGDTLLQTNHEHGVAVPYCRFGPRSFRLEAPGTTLWLVVLSEREVIGGVRTEDCTTRTTLTWQGPLPD